MPGAIVERLELKRQGKGFVAEVGRKLQGSFGFTLRVGGQPTPDAIGLVPKQ